MPLVRPRLTDHYGLPISQEEADFAIPFLDEDIPLSLDPFLLWKSPAQHDNTLHTAIVNSFNHLGYLIRRGKKNEAVKTLITLSECEEVGLGFSATRTGKRIGHKTANSILTLFEVIPQVTTGGFTHFEEIQLLVDGVSKDRVSDIACNYMKSFLIDFTIDQCQKHNVPMQTVVLPAVYNYRFNRLDESQKVKLPTSPRTGHPVILVPKRWLRAIPWLNFEDYINNFYLKEVLKAETDGISRVAVLNYNREHYDCVCAYAAAKERDQKDCGNDPLFSQLPVFSVTRKVAKLAKLPSGNQDSNDKEYEKLMEEMLPSMLYPHLDFADSQVRTESGVLIRDLVFYNSRSHPFLKDVYDKYGSTQIVFELKNVKEIDRDHINQLNRYLNEHFGKFGVLVTRNDLPKPMFKNTIDLWSAQRRCIIALTDEDITVMGDVFRSKQRLPIEVVNKKCVEFLRACPS
jgi:hypothetical protein